MVRSAKRFEDFSGVNCKPGYPGGDEMFRELKKLRHRFYQRELTQTLTEKIYEPDLSAKTLKNPPAKKFYKSAAGRSCAGICAPLWSIG